MGIIVEAPSLVAGRVELMPKAFTTVPDIQWTLLVFVLLILAGFKNFLK